MHRFCTHGFHLRATVGGPPVTALVVCLTIIASASGCTPPIAGEPPQPPIARTARKPVVPDGSTTTRRRVPLGSPELLSGIPGSGSLSTAEISEWLDDPAHLAPLEVELPSWLRPGAGQVKDLADNPLSPAKVELGRQLFFERRLSADNTVSCASCHEPSKGFAIDTPLAKGVGGREGRRHPPTLLNRIMLSVGEDRQHWDGRSTSVEDALLHALSDPNEMAADPTATEDKLRSIDGYRMQFDAVYGGVSWDAIGDAIGGFVRCLVTGPSPFDHEVRWRSYRDLDPDLLREDPVLAGHHAAARAAAEREPMSEAALRGERIFFGERAWCTACHNGVNFTDESFHNIGVGLDRPGPDLGRYAVTGRDEDWAAFKTPTIRGVTHTAPYMHDGSLATLEDVVDWYAHEGRANRNLDYRFKRIAGGDLTERDRNDLVAFMRSLGGPLPRVETGRLPD